MIGDSSRGDGSGATHARHAAGAGWGTSIAWSAVFSALLACSGPSTPAGLDAGVDGGFTPRRDAGPQLDAGPDCGDAPACGGRCCALDEACVAETCCATEQRCGAGCCGADSRCVDGRCELDCGAREACAEAGGARCCAAGELCYLGACQAPGAACSELEACPVAEYCEVSISRCLPRAPGEACEVRPEPGALDPQVRWHWSGDPSVPGFRHVQMSPVVINLTDDDGDGRIDADDVPDVVFAANAVEGGAAVSDTRFAVLFAVSGADGSRVWPIGDPGFRVQGLVHVAAGDVDPASPGPEIVACEGGGAGLATVLLGADGRVLRTLRELRCTPTQAFAIADLDADGVPEIVSGRQAAHADGTLLPGLSATGPTSTWDYVAVADLDEDGRSELIGAGVALRVDGSTLWDQRPAIEGRFVAVADVHPSAGPEVLVAGGGVAWLLAGPTGEPIWGPISYTTGAQVGAPVIGNLRGDVAPELGLSAGQDFVAIDPVDGAELWRTAVGDGSATAAGIFDFEGDGRADVVKLGDFEFFVLGGEDGRRLFSTCNTSGTLQEYPVVADVDNDGSAEIVVTANDDAPGYVCSGTSAGVHGVRVFAHPERGWVRTRRVWNQHTYHVTNVGEDGAIPRREAPHWRSAQTNLFRGNVQPEGLFDAPDLVLRDLAWRSSCSGAAEVRVRVANVGAASAPAGVPLTLLIDGAEVASATTTRRLLAGATERVAFSFAWPDGRASVSAEIVIGADERLEQCRVDNDRLGPAELRCSALE